MNKRSKVVRVQKLVLLFFYTGMLALCSCMDAIIDEELAREEDELIQQYLIDHEIDAVPTTSGLYYIETEEGDSTQPELDDYILIEFTGRSLRDNIMFATTDYSYAFANSIYSEDILYGPRKTMVNNLRYDGLKEGIQIMKEGGSAQLILPSYLAEKDYEPLIYEVTLLKVIKDPATYEQKLLDEYLKLLSITLNWRDDNSILTPKNGIYYIETEAGTKKMISEGDSITIAYEGKLLDGRVFDSYTEEKPLGLNITADFSLIPGFLQGIKLMSEGSSGILIIPYDMAYGIEGKDKKIPPYSTLVYNIKILNVFEQK